MPENTQGRNLEHRGEQLTRNWSLETVAHFALVGTICGSNPAGTSLESHHACPVRLGNNWARRFPKTAENLFSHYHGDVVNASNFPSIVALSQWEVPQDQWMSGNVELQWERGHSKAKNVEVRKGRKTSWFMSFLWSLFGLNGCKNKTKHCSIILYVLFGKKIIFF